MRRVACEECRDLTTHTFRTTEDLTHALRTAAAEVDRGVLAPLREKDLAAHEQEALYSALAADAVPDVVRYRFECRVCGDRFELWADTGDGGGGWRREEKPC
jgi:hypothetical protein